MTAYILEMNLFYRLMGALFISITIVYLAAKSGARAHEVFILAFLMNSGIVLVFRGMEE